MSTQRILVWDIPTRLFHWLLAGSFAGAWLTSESERLAAIHVGCGYALLGLIGFRLIYGLVGSRYARFSEFVRGPGAVIAFTGFALVWLAACHWLVRHVRANAFFRLCYEWSARITLFFVIHWIIIGWGIGLVGHTQHGIPMVVFLTVAVLVLTDSLVRQIVTERRYAELAQPCAFLTAKVAEHARK